MYKNFGLTFLLTSILFCISLVVCDVLSNATDYSELKDNLSSSRLLSRRKRFIIFPDGSSFQLVICTQNQGYIQVGDIVLFGNTAALAWELPSDPLLFYYFKDAKKGLAAQRRTDPTKHIYYLNESGKVIAKVPYKKRPIVNPAFAKRSVTGQEGNEETKKLFIKEMHGLQKNLSHFKNLDAASVEFHREGRRSLYAKLEKFMEAMGWRGRECVLQMLCGAGKSGDEQGTFLQEILRAVFTLPQGRDFSSEEDKQYDIAHGAGVRDDCAELYPGCKDLYGSSQEKK